MTEKNFFDNVAAVTMGSNRTLKQFWEAHRLHAATRHLLQPLAQALAREVKGIPVIVVSYNNAIYVRNITSQLQRFGIRPIVIDNRSNDPTSQLILAEMQQKGDAQVIFSRRNFGHMVGFLQPVYELLPTVFGYTDPDLQLSPSMPSDFLPMLAGLTKEYSVFKTGLALDLKPEEAVIQASVRICRRKPIPINREFPVREWEAQYWRMRLAHPSLELYAADIDTTFAVYRKTNFKGNFYDAVRVAGSYSAVHLPWYPNLDLMSREQRQIYLRGNNSSAWLK